MNLSARTSLYFFSSFLAFVFNSSSNSAHAAAALAGGSTNYTHASTNKDSIAEAEKKALANCAENSPGCKIMISFTGAGALAIAKGSNGRFAVADKDPKIAAKMAVKACTKEYKNCKLTAIYWESGDRWASFARALKPNDKNAMATYFSYDNDSRPEAEAAALVGCNNNLKTIIVSKPSAKGAVCSIDNTFAGAGFHVQASSAESEQTWTATSDSLAKSRESVITACKISLGTAATCKTTAEYSNPSTALAPSSFAAVYATTEVSIANRNTEITTRHENTIAHEKNVVSCTNQCTNGSCLRTFSNGRSERWQAPRVFDPIASDWKWETASCGK